MTETTLEKTDKRSNTMEFIPFGQPDPIKLSIKIIQDLVAVPTKSGQTCSERDALRFMMLCQAQRLNPFAGDAFLTGYDGRDGSGPKFSLITAHVAMLKRAESSQDFEGMESGIIFRADKDSPVSEREGDFYQPPEVVVGGWARVFRKGRKATYRRLSIAAMRPAYDTPFWNADKAPGQIVKCAEADALRSTFPSLMAGLYIEGERLPVVETEVVTKRPEPTGLQKALQAPDRKSPVTGNIYEKPENTLAAGAAAVTGGSPTETPNPGQSASPPEFKPRNGESEALTNVRSLLHKFSKTEEALLLLGREKKWAKDSQKLSDLSDNKLKMIVTAWDMVLADLNKEAK